MLLLFLKVLPMYLVYTTPQEEYLPLTPIGYFDRKAVKIALKFGSLRICVLRVSHYIQKEYASGNGQSCHSHKQYV